MDLKRIHSTIVSFFLLGLLSSCGEEILTQNTLSETFLAHDIETFQQNTCSAMRLIKPPVDILFVVDNTGSTLDQDFQAIRNQIAATVSTISNEFDYHIYIAPLKKLPGQDNSAYPLIVSDTSTLNTTALNIMQLKDLGTSNFFNQATGGSTESGFERVYELVNENTANGIFRPDAHTITVMISNGDDTDVIKSSNFGKSFDPVAFAQKKQKLLGLAATLNSESFRFISLVPHTSCHGWRAGTYYKRMSAEIYDAHPGSVEPYGDDPSMKNSRDLCSKNYSNLFSVVNNSIRHQLVGHKYDHWKISSAQSSAIQEDDITVLKVSQNGATVSIPQSTQNGYEYLGYKQNINTRYLPDPGEPVTGLVIKLNGNARVAYPDCIIAKTRTPTEYFGYAVLPREPQVETLKIEINSQDIPSDSQNGWTYEGYKETLNIKVPGPEGVSTEPAIFKSGYFIKFNGSSIYTNGDKINIYYKPKAI